MFRTSFDIFCHVIDNFGDIGVCLRLARQLDDYGHTVRIFTDKPAIFHKLDAKLKLQILDWQLANTVAAPKHGVVIEAFACELPATYKKTIATQASLWINLEYLSAEKWVESFHALPSLQDDGSNKYFFFPGFKQNTGGLLRETNLLKEKNAFNRTKRNEFLAKISKSTTTDIDPNSFLIFLFCYPSAPTAGLISALQASGKNVCLLTAHGINIEPQEIPAIKLPFIEQTDFDKVLWACDLNLVRGEDSFVRSIWSAQPMLWQAYEQADNIHLDKLAAWLELSQAPDLIKNLYMAWNTQDNQATSKFMLQALQKDFFPTWQQHSSNLCTKLTQQSDLLTNLNLFCAGKLKKH